MRQSLKSISLTFFLVLSALNAHAQQRTLVDSVGFTNKYAAMIEMPKAYLSGVCILKKNEEGIIMGCLFNEFGISALAFSYRPGDKKAKLLNIIKMMDKWYIKRIISRDLAKVYQYLLLNKTIYRNEKYHITYRLTPMQEAKRADSHEDEHQ